MNKNNFSSEITKLMTCPQAMERYKISRLTLMTYAKKIGAVVRFGRSVRIDMEKFDAWVNAEGHGIQ